MDKQLEVYALTGKQPWTNFTDQGNVRPQMDGTLNAAQQRNTKPNAMRTTLMPSDNKPKSNVFCYAALPRKQKGMLCTNDMGALSTLLMDANRYYPVVYDYDNNSIFAEPITNVKDNIIIDAFCMIAEIYFFVSVVCYVTHLPLPMYWSAAESNISVLTRC